MDYKIFKNFLLQIIIYIIIIIFLFNCIDFFYTKFFVRISILTQIRVKIFVYSAITLVYSIYLIKETVRFKFIEYRINLVVFILLQMIVLYIFKN